MATYTELVAAAAERLNLTSAEALARLGRYLNTRYKRITTTLGLVTSRRTNVQATASIGVQTLTFDAIEKIITVSDRSSGSDVFLEEVSPEELTGALANNASIGTGQPTRYAIYRMNKGSVQILMDTVPQTGFTLYAEGHATASTLSGAQEPGFSESYHDILLFGMLADEYKKLEMLQYAKDAEKDYESRLSDLRYFIAKSAMTNPYQGRSSAAVTGGGGSSTGSGVSGSATNYTQTGLITFDRSGAGAGSDPFAVAAGSGKVDNLDADLLDGEEGSAYHNATNLNAGLVPDARLTSSTTSTSTGAQNNWAPTLSGNYTYINWSGASAMAATGLAGGSAGMLVTIYNSGSFVATFASASGSSVAANRFVNTAASAPTPINTGGYITYRHDGTNWKLVSHEQGAWITPTFAAGNFTGNGSMTWTLAAGDVLGCRYWLRARTLTVSVDLATATVGGTPDIALQVGNGAWGAFSAASTSFYQAVAYANDAGTVLPSMINPISGTTLGVLKTNGANWTAGTNDNHVRATITFEVT